LVYKDQLGYKTASAIYINCVGQDCSEGYNYSHDPFQDFSFSTKNFLLYIVMNEWIQTHHAPSLVTHHYKTNYENLDLIEAASDGL
jgi:hypothetical protein